jgi:hypothetical protein
MKLNAQVIAYLNSLRFILALQEFTDTFYLRKTDSSKSVIWNSDTEFIRMAVST